jgi:hypothetical protein
VLIIGEVVTSTLLLVRFVPKGLDIGESVELRFVVRKSSRERVLLLRWLVLIAADESYEFDIWSMCESTVACVLLCMLCIFQSWRLVPAAATSAAILRFQVVAHRIRLAFPPFA